MHLVYQVRHFVEHAKSLIFCAFTALLRPGRAPKRSESDFEVGQTTKFDKLPINGRDLSSQLSLADISLTNAGMHLLYSAFRRLFFLFCRAERLCLEEAGCPWNTKTVQHQRHCVLTLLKNTLWVTHSFRAFSTNNTGISPAFTKLPRACDRNTAATSKSASKQRGTQTLTAWRWK